MAVLAYLVLFLAFAGHSSATYCLCKDGVGDSALQKAIDYACGAGADCTPILQSGSCYNPNTVKDHCNYAVNSYYQKKGQAQGSCDFSGSAAVSQTAPQQTTSTCVYPSSASTSTTPSGTTTPSTTGTTTPSTTGTTTGTTSPSVFNTPTGLGPTGSGFDSKGVALSKGKSLLYPIALAMLFFSGLMLQQ